MPGAQWGNGAIGNARWTGVRLKDVLDRAGIADGVRCRSVSPGLDTPPPDAPLFAESLDLAHAMDGEVMIAFQMNGALLPISARLSAAAGRARLVFDRLGEGARPDRGAGRARYGLLMEKAYRIPATPRASARAGRRRFPDRSDQPHGPAPFITNIADGEVSLRRRCSISAVSRWVVPPGARVDLSADGGTNWTTATLGPDQADTGSAPGARPFSRLVAGPHRLAVRCTSEAGEVQRFLDPIWDPGGRHAKTRSRPSR